MSKRFRVIVPVIHNVHFEVEADNEEDAKELVTSGDVDPVGWDFARLDEQDFEVEPL